MGTNKDRLCRKKKQQNGLGKLLVKFIMRKIKIHEINDRDRLFFIDRIYVKRELEFIYLFH